MVNDSAKLADLEERLDYAMKLIADLEEVVSGLRTWVSELDEKVLELEVYPSYNCLNFKTEE